MAAASEIILPKNFDINLLTVGPIKKRDNGGKAAYFSYNGMSTVCVQTPVMSAPFGIRMWAGENGAPDKYNLDLSFDQATGGGPHETFLNMVKAVEERVLQEAWKNMQPWFNKRHPAIEVLDALYTRAVRYSKDKETGEIVARYPPTFKMALPMKDGAFVFPAFGGNRQPIDLHKLIESGRSKSARAQAIVQLSSVWVVDKKFGVTWRVRQLRVIEAPQLGLQFAFQGTEEEPLEDTNTAAAGDVEEAAAPAPAPPPARPALTERNYVTETDDEEDV